MQKSFNRSLLSKLLLICFLCAVIPAYVIHKVDIPFFPILPFLPLYGLLLVIPFVIFQLIGGNGVRPREKPEEKIRVENASAGWIHAVLLFIILVYYWYFHSSPALLSVEFYIFVNTYVIAGVFHAVMVLTFVVGCFVLSGRKSFCLVFCHCFSFLYTFLAFQVAQSVPPSTILFLITIGLLLHICSLGFLVFLSRNRKNRIALW